jgi:hypothetical protein
MTTTHILGYPRIGPQREAEVRPRKFLAGQKLGF